MVEYCIMSAPRYPIHAVVSAAFTATSTAPSCDDLRLTPSCCVPDQLALILYKYNLGSVTDGRPGFNVISTFFHLYPTMPVSVLPLNISSTCGSMPPSFLRIHLVGRGQLM